MVYPNDLKYVVALPVIDPVGRNGPDVDRSSIAEANSPSFQHTRSEQANHFDYPGQHAVCRQLIVLSNEVVGLTQVVLGVGRGDNSHDVELSASNCPHNFRQRNPSPRVKLIESSDESVLFF